MKKNWSRVPPSFLLEEECHRNMAFTLFHADQLPNIELLPVEIESLPNEITRLTVTLQNDRMIPTRLEQDIVNHIHPPDIVSASGDAWKVITSGVVTDRFRNLVEATRRRPERVEVKTVPAMARVRVQFMVTGSGEGRITFESLRGGVRTRTFTLPR
jgi:hypothetical protein